MGTRELIEHMSVRGVLTTQVKQTFADSPVLNNAVIMSGNPKSPYTPSGYSSGAPRASNMATAEMLASLTANALWLRNQSPNPGLSTNAATVRPILVAPYELARRSMLVNDMSMMESPSLRVTGGGFMQRKKR